MRTITRISDMQAFSASARMEGKRISFVPTMGYLHEGHLSLMREGRRRGDVLVTSIFVNPTQFGAGEDLEKYPRDFARDERCAAEAGVDVIFYPSAGEMYPHGFQTYVTVEDVTKNLCGLSRPGHFRGVATVCAKLFNIVAPHVAVFGKKDFQQLVTICRMVTDLNMDLEIIGAPTVREHDGLAMSSRNTYLTDEERQSALSLSRSLLMTKGMYDEGERNTKTIITKVSKLIESQPHTAIDYVRICDTATMDDVKTIENEAVIALAVFVGKTRLIDNYVFGETLDIAQ